MRRIRYRQDSSYEMISYLDEKRDGIYESYDRDGCLQRRSMYVNGILNGVDDRYFRKIPISKTRMFNGKKNGRELLYDKLGIIVSEKNYKNDLLDGIATVYHSDGITKATETLFSEGIAIKVILSQDRSGKNKLIPEGNIIVWKSALSKCGEPVFIQIEVNEKIERVTPHQAAGLFKSRIASGLVINIFNKEKKEYDKAISFVYGDNSLVYRKGQHVFPDKFDSNPNNDSSHGINVHVDIEDCYQWFI
ncbi:MAG: hypothetical protein Harvfovirus22_10 [Harvfovirus sp.]|uniref:Uncharacterized protein n=1 Tax=Harvfovirus sp. TaxID=2487768 RepID=A0A3G5A212_9VIRU|nr:MAG: hypothetical protein Harvfovirus22_10 [Harvfovirus sp.]